MSKSLRKPKVQADQQKRFSIRKYSLGVASVAIGLCLFGRTEALAEEVGGRIESTLETINVSTERAVEVNNELVGDASEYLSDANEIDSVRDVGIDGDGKAIDLVIPEGITEIEDGRYRDANIRSVSFPTTLQKIGQDAFRGTNIQKIMLPDSVTEIGTGAFGDIREVQNVRIPKSLSTARLAFNMSNIKNVEFAEGIEKIAEELFFGSKLTEIRLPEGVKEIGESAFASSSLDTVYIPNSVVKIGGEAFRNTHISNINLPEGIQHIGNRAFSEILDIQNVRIPKSLSTARSAFNMSNIKNVEFTEGIEKIAEELFFGSKLTEIRLPEGIKEIGESAFASSSLDTVYIPNSVVKIGEEAFRNTHISNINLPEGIQHIGNRAFSEILDIQNVRIPKSLSTARSAFNMSNIKNVEFAEGIEKIVDGLLSGARLETIILPETTHEIGESSFKESGLKMISFPSHLKIISEDAFEGTELSEVILPEGMETIGVGAFSRIPSIKKIYIPRSLANVEQMGPFSSISVFADSGINTIDFNEHTTEIPNKLFGHSKIEFLRLPNGLRKIGKGAFDSAGLKSIVLPNNLEIIEDEAFKNNDIDSINFPDSLKKIGNLAFYKNKLKDIVLPKKLEELGWGAFSNIQNVNRVYIPNILRTPSMEKHELFIGPFSDTVIKHVDFADGLKVIPKRIFFNTKVESVRIPEGVETIGEQAFESSSLSYVEFPKSLKMIEEKAFFNTGLLNLNLKNISKLGDNTYGGSIFGGTNIKNIELPVTVLEINGALQDMPNLEKVYFSRELVSLDRDWKVNSPNAMPYVYSDSKIARELESRGEEYRLRDVLPRTSAILNRAKSEIIDTSEVLKKSGYLTIDVRYEILEDEYDNLSNKEIVLNIPSNFKLSKEMVKLNGSLVTEIGSNPKELRIREVPRQGKIEVVYISNTDKFETAQINARLNYRKNGEDKHEFIDIKEFETPTFTLHPGYNFLKKEINLSGYVSEPSSVLNVYIGNQLIGANIDIRKDGGYRFNKEISNYINGDKITLKAELISSTGKRVVLERLINVSYNQPVVNKLEIKHGNNTLTLDSESITKPIFSVIPDDSTEFRVKIDNAENVKFVIMEIFDGDNKKVKILQRDSEEKDVYVGRIETMGYLTPDSIRVIPVTREDREIDQEEIADILNILKGDGDAEENTASTGEVLVPENNSGSTEDVSIPEDNSTSTEETTKTENDVSEDEYSGKSVRETNRKVMLKRLGQTLNKGLRNSTDSKDVEQAFRALSNAEELFSTLESGAFGVGDLMRALQAVESLEEFQVFSTAMEILADSKDEIRSLVSDIFDEGFTKENLLKIFEVSGEMPQKFINEVLRDGIFDGVEKGIEKFILGDVGTVGGLAFYSAVELVKSIPELIEIKKQFDAVKDELIRDASKLNPVDRDKRLRAIETASFLTSNALTANVILRGVQMMGVVLAPPPFNVIIFVATEMFVQTYNMDMKSAVKLARGEELNWFERKLYSVVDPSGSVVNQVTNQPIVNAEASIYFKGEDGQEVLWDAGEYSQINPQLTNKQGAYAWDVPKGMWKVKVSKAGYESQESDWLPVPPPQTEINFRLNPISYKIQYQLNDGKFESSELMSYQTDVKQELPLPIREGYTFVGWFDNEALNGTPIQDTLFAEIGDKQLWAKWEKTNSTDSVVVDEIKLEDVSGTTNRTTNVRYVEKASYTEAVIKKEDETLLKGLERVEESIPGKIIVEITELVQDGKVISRSEKEILRTSPVPKIIYIGTLVSEKLGNNTSILTAESDKQVEEVTSLLSESKDTINATGTTIKINENKDRNEQDNIGNDILTRTQKLLKTTVQQEKSKLETAMPNESVEQADSTVRIELLENLPITGEQDVLGLFSVAALSILSSVGLAATSMKRKTGVR